MTVGTTLHHSPIDALSRVSSCGSPLDSVQFRIELGEQIYRLRRATGLSQASLASLAGVTQASISNYERGTREPLPCVLTAIASGLSCAMGDILPPAHVVYVKDVHIVATMRDVIGGSRSISL